MIMSIKCLLNGIEVNYPCSSVCNLFGDCVTAFETQKKANVRTNADRIRAMSDEELASMFNKAVVCHSLRELGYCHKCPLFGAKPCDTEGLLEWLQQPAEVDNG
jgi:hypothetical protein